MFAKPGVHHRLIGTRSLVETQVRFLFPHSRILDRPLWVGGFGQRKVEAGWLAGDITLFRTRDVSQAKGRSSCSQASASTVFFPPRLVVLPALAFWRYTLEDRISPRTRRGVASPRLVDLWLGRAESRRGNMGGKLITARAWDTSACAFWTTLGLHTSQVFTNSYHGGFVLLATRPARGHAVEQPVRSGCKMQCILF